MKSCVLAVDGGGTKSLAVTYQAGKGILGIGRGGSSNFQCSGIEGAMISLEKALEEAGAAGIRKFACAAFAMAGVDTEKDEITVGQMVGEVLKKMGLEADKIIIKNDGEMTLLGTLREKPGMLVLAGTGSIVVAGDGRGKTVRVGGWGHRLGDEGSAYYIGRKGLIAAFQGYDGRKDAEKLLEKILSDLNLNDVSELKDWVYDRSRTVADIAALAPTIIKLAEQGDGVCRDIVDGALEELISSVNTAYRKILQPEKRFTVILQGGIFQHSSFYRQKFIERLKSSYPDVGIQEPRYQPVVGALYLALKCAGMGEIKSSELERHPLLLLRKAN